MSVASYFAVFIAAKPIGIFRVSEF